MRRACLFVWLVTYTAFCAAAQTVEPPKPTRQADLSVMTAEALLGAWENASGRVEKRQIEQALIKKAWVSAETLRETALAGSEEQKMLCLNLIAKVKDKGSEGELIECLKDPSESVRAAAAWVLGLIGDEDAESAVRDCAMDQLGGLRSPETIQVVENVDTNPIRCGSWTDRFEICAD